MFRILFCGGGSVGHIAPSVAVWETLKQTESQSKPMLICSYASHDRAFLKKNNLPFYSIAAPKLAGISSIILLPILFPIALLQACIAFLLFRPHVIFAKGGYVCVPVCLIGKLLRIPIVLHESDSSLGRANRALMPLARIFCIGAAQKELGDLKKHSHVECIATGNPVRSSFLHTTADAGKRITGFSGKKPVLFIWGGSQGAKVLNGAVRANIDMLLDICDVIHITGKKKMGTKKNHAKYWQREFVDEELPDLLALADIVLSRGGAGSIAELAVMSKPTILVPLPGLAHNHQVQNAQHLQNVHAVTILDQETLHETLVPRLRELFSDPHALHSMGERLNTFCNPHAATAIANILLEVAKGRR